jgi:hypothetical protein
VKKQRVKRQKPDLRRLSVIKLAAIRVAARVVRVPVDPERPRVHVEVRISRTRRLMRMEMMRQDRIIDSPKVEGLVSSWHWARGVERERGKLRPNGVIARMYLDAKAIRRRPNEIASHESGHAAMAYARYCSANLRHMPGEEIMCHALGRITAGVVSAMYSQRVFV